MSEETKLDDDNVIDVLRGQRVKLLEQDRTIAAAIQALEPKRVGCKVSTRLVKVIELDDVCDVCGAEMANQDPRMMEAFKSGQDMKITCGCGRRFIAHRSQLITPSKPRRRGGKLVTVK